MTTSAVELPRHTAVVSAAKRAANYYRPTYRVATGPRNGWSWATYFDGLHQLYRGAGDGGYLRDLDRWGAENAWAPSSRGTNPDSVKAGQTYFDVQPVLSNASLSPMDQRISTDLAALPDSQYSWIDALYMGLPNWPRWATRTGDPAYLTKMDALYASTRDNGITGLSGCAGKAPGLYDRTERLWYRDCRFIGERDLEGHPIFWARGNAWVMAAMAEVLQSLPAGDPRARTYGSMLQSMAGRLRALQGADGFWRASLLSPDLYPEPETSSTALFAYALGYGIRTGLLDQRTYLPVVARAWEGLVKEALQPSGFLRGCQPVGDRPAATYRGTAPRTAATASSPGTVHIDSPPYCVGAFLLAAGELSRQTSAMTAARPVVATGQDLGHEPERAVDGDVTTQWSATGFPQSVTVDVGRGFQASNAVVTSYLDRAYRYRIETSTDGTHWTRVVDRTANTIHGSLLNDFSTGTTDLRYARLTVTGVYATTTNQVSISEFSLHDRFRPRSDAAYRRPAGATSSVQRSSPADATDHLPSSCWTSAAIPSAVAPQRLTIDLQAVSTVDTVQLTSGPGHGPRAASVQTSTDGTTWTTAQVFAPADSSVPQLMLVSPVQARWVRLAMTQAYGTAGPQVCELGVYRH